MSARRIASLLPGATEMLVALGLGDRLVGRSHECDWPPEVAGVPVVTEGLLPPGGGQREVDDAVRVAAAAGTGLGRVRDEALAAARPDLLVTQSLCEVCAVDGAEAARAAAALPGPPPEVLALAPATLAGVLDAMRVLGAVAGAPERAEAAVRGLRERLQRVAAAVAGRPAPRVACLEWLDPPFAAGHWVPSQVAAAGGRDVLAAAGARSVQVRPEDVVAAAPEVLVLMPCGLDADAAAAAAAAAGVLQRYAATAAVRGGRVVAVDASGCFSRPGPRVVDGVEALAAVLHPGALPPPPPGRVVALGAPPGPPAS